MSNEEKARELAYNTAICEGTWSCLGSSEEDESICIKCNKYHRILEMAEWKDQQFIETAQEDAESYVKGVAKANPDLNTYVLNYIETAYIAGRNRIK